MTLYHLERFSTHQAQEVPIQNVRISGHVVGIGEVRPNSSKVQAVEKFPVPKTKRQVRAFRGLTGYYRQFILHYAQTAAVLTDLTQKDFPNKVIWTPECQRAFTELKCSSAVLRSPTSLSFRRTCRIAVLEQSLVNATKMGWTDQSHISAENCYHWKRTTLLWRNA